MPVNVQHDCVRAQCKPSLNTYEVQEHEQTQRQAFRIAHLDEDNFVLNTSALHNAHVLARLLPLDFIQAPPLVSDRTQHHQAVSQKLQEIVSGKQEFRKAKRQLAKVMRSGPSGTPMACHNQPYNSITSQDVPATDHVM